MRLNKPLSLLLTCVLVFALLLTGCSDTPDQPSDGTTTQSTTTATNDGGDTTTTDGDVTDDTTTTGGDTTVSDDTTSDNGSTMTTNGSTTTSVTSSTTGAEKEEPLMPSFIRNDDGTCTDRDTGVVFIDDDCNSVTVGAKDCKLYDCGGKVHVDENQRALMNNDPARFVRGGTSGASNWWVSYKLPKGVTEVAIESTSMHTDWIGFDVFVSKDRKKWTKVDLKIDSKETKNLGYGWYLRIHKATGIDSANTYVKVQFTADLNGAFYDPNICRIRINNIDKMNDPDRFLEGRTSKTFYVSTSGSDANDGLSPEKPWKTTNAVSSRYYQPGDKILFKAGDTFTGTVKITGFGSVAKRVTVGTYGGDKKATIQSRSAANSIFEIACDYITVENLTITNKQGGIGMLVCAADVGANKDIIIQNCNFKDININAENFKYESGALQFNATGTEPTWFENVTVRNNTFENVARCGVYATNSWGSRDKLVNGEYKNGDKPWYANRNFNISNNTLLDVQGDAIFINNCNGLVIERNFVNNAFCVEENALKAARDEGINHATAGIWTINADKAYIQYNDVGYTNLPFWGADGEAFDIDGKCTEHYIQYNYSHDNEGGFILLCDVSASYELVKQTEHNIRFNLSVNDACKDGQGVFMTAKTFAEMNIYNNTIIQTSTKSRLLYNFGDIQKYNFINNIFYGASACTIGTQPGTNSDVLFDNNIFCGGTPTTSSKGITIKNVVTTDPKFKNETFTNASGKNLRKEAIAAFTPQTKVSGASTIKNNGGKDINGTAISNNFYGCVKY